MGSAITRLHSDGTFDAERFVETRLTAREHPVVVVVDPGRRIGTRVVVEETKVDTATDGEFLGTDRRIDGETALQLERDAEESDRAVDTEFGRTRTDPTTDGLDTWTVLGTQREVDGATTLTE